MKYNQVVEKFLRYLESIDRSSETIEGYRKELAYFEEFLLDKYSIEKHMYEITLEDLEGYMYYIKMKGKKSPQEIGLYISLEAYIAMPIKGNYVRSNYLYI